MAFSFNWAGLNVPTVNYFDAVKDPNVGANLGLAARGFEKRQAAKEYADKIREYRMGRSAAQNTAKSRIDEIRAEIAQLKQENAMIESQMQSAQPSQETQLPGNDPSGSTAISDLTNTLDALSFDPNTASKEDIINMQNMLVNHGYNLGTYGPNRNGVDGSWGRKSKNALAQYLSTL